MAGEAPVPHLARAPITEAILDLWIDDVLKDVSALRPFTEEVAKAFPFKERRVDMQARFGMADGATMSEARSTDIGFLCRSSDRLDVVQARVDGFTVNRLRPYKAWQQLKQAAMDYWPIYCRFATPNRVRRMGLRFTNQFDLPLSRSSLTIGNIARFMTWHPGGLPGGTASLVDGFMLRTAFHPEPSVKALVTVLSVDGASSDDVVPFVLDLEVTREGDWAPNSPEIWSSVEQLRRIKNQVFFKSITPALTERFT